MSRCCTLYQSKNYSDGSYISKSYVWSSLLVHKTRLGLIFMAIISKNYENGPNYPLKWSPVTPVGCYTNVKTVEISFWKPRSQKVNHYFWMIDVGSLKSLSRLKMKISSKMSPEDDLGDPQVNAVKLWKSSKSVKMMSGECIMVVFDCFYS